MSLIFFDSLVRFSAIAILLIVATLAIRDAKEIKSSLYLIGLGVTLTATLISYTLEPIRLSGLLYTLARIIDIPNIIFVWFFSLSLFNDEFEIKWKYWSVAGLYVGLVALLRFGQFNIIPQHPYALLVIIDLLALLIVIHLMMITLAGRRDDLLEARRRSRFYFVITLAFTILIYALSDVLLVTPYAELVPTIKATIVLPSIIWTAFWFLKLSPDALTFETQSETIEPQLSEREEELAEKLSSVMQGEKAYLQSGLTIEHLATQIGSTEHALRALINGQLGYRHFSSYLNSMRIAHVKEDFLNPRKSDTSILTIALDAGFNSISPFNRAFKKIEGITPSQFRRERKK